MIDTVVLAWLGLPVAIGMGPKRQVQLGIMSGACAHRDVCWGMLPKAGVSTVCAHYHLTTCCRSMVRSCSGLQRLP